MIGNQNDPSQANPSLSPRHCQRDAGMPADTPILKLFERVQRELDDMRGKVIEAQATERRNGG